jgi:hypothetical protein
MKDAVRRVDQRFERFAIGFESETVCSWTAASA